jgi:hypothetical protein
MTAAGQPDFRDRLREELARRRRVNPRYSLRAFGEWLDVDHSTLSQILKDRRDVPPRLFVAWAEKLGLSSEEIAVYSAAADAEGQVELDARIRRRLWLGEASTLMSAPAHWRLLQLLRNPEWRPAIRWAPRQLCLGVDDLNDAFSRLLRLDLLRVDANGVWRDTSGLREPTEAGVKKRALERLRLAMSAG